MIAERMIAGNMISDHKNVDAPSAPAVSAPSVEAATNVASQDPLLRAAANPALTEDLALSLLKRADLPVEVLEQLARNANALKPLKVKLALVSHPRAPRHVSVPLIRQFCTFDLMKVALTPTVPADVKVAADDVLVARLKSVTLGERLGLARQGSGRIAGALLLDGEPQVMRTALENARLTEAFVIQSVLRHEATATLVQAVAQHREWSYRREVRIALMRTEHLSLARTLEFSHGLPLPLLREVLTASRLSTRIKEQVLREAEAGFSL
jgi:hypothetical protein